jgi:hypothetical protein
LGLIFALKLKTKKLLLVKMGNQQSAKSHSDCRILIIGAKESGKTTLFHKFINEYTQKGSSKLRIHFLEQFLSQIFYITLKMAKICKKEEFKNIETLKIFLELEKNPQVSNLKKFKKEICTIWEEKVMKQKLESKKDLFNHNNDT